MAAKKTKKAAPKNKEEKQPELLAEVTQADFLTLQIGAKSLENIQLKMKLAQISFGEMQTEKDRLEQQLQNLNTQVNEKYKLTPGKDQINIDTGAITRG